MIKLNNDNVLQHRKGEEKTKVIGKLMHNPEVSGPVENRQPFFYHEGLRLTADDCIAIANELRRRAGEHQFTTLSEKRFNF